MKKNLSRYAALGLLLVSCVFQIAVVPNSNIHLLDAEGLSFSELGVEEQVQLRGPYQEFLIKFALPVDWQVDGNIDLKLDVTGEFQSLLEAFTTEDSEVEYGFKKGFLRAELNGVSMGEAEINSDRTQTVVFTAPGDLINQDSRENEIVISWDAGDACDHSVTSLISISTESEIIIQHFLKATSLKLKDFPAPFIYDNAFISYPVSFVIPDKPDESVLSALMAVSSAFGRLGGEGFIYEIISTSELDQKQYADHQFVFVGDIGQVNEMLVDGMGGSELVVPDVVTGSDNGYLKYQISPWNNGRTIFIVTGENGTALKKASSIISADSIILFLDGNSAVIQDIEDPSKLQQYQIDHSLSDLVSEKTLQVTSLDETLVEIPFSIPGDQQISPESYLELYFRHSQLINYLQSNISIFINNNLIGTIRFSDHSAENGLVRVILPPNVLKPLQNELLISFTISPQDICADERTGDYWITIFGDSYLHIPPVLETDVESQAYTFGNLSSGLMRDGSFSNLIFLVDRNEKQEWVYASRIAYTLGMFTDANIIQPTVRYADSINELENNKDYILISDLNAVPSYGEINEYLPLPINAGSGLSEESLAGIKFEIDSRQDIGVIESAIIQDQRTTILGVFGNSSEGFEAAVNALTGMITGREGADANVEIIDSEGESHYYKFEQKKTVNKEEATSEWAWFDRFSSLAMQELTLYLFIFFVVVLITFSVWVMRKK